LLVAIAAALLLAGSMAAFRCSRNVQPYVYEGEESMSFEEAYFESFAECGYVKMKEVPEEGGVNGRSVKLNTDEIGELLSCLQSARLNNDIKPDSTTRNEYILLLYDSNKEWSGCLGVVDGHVLCDDGEVESDELESLVLRLTVKYFPKKWSCPKL